MGWFIAGILVAALVVIFRVQVKAGLGRLRDWLTSKAPGG